MYSRHDSYKPSRWPRVQSTGWTTESIVPLTEAFLPVIETPFKAADAIADVPHACTWGESGKGCTLASPPDGKLKLKVPMECKHLAIIWPLGHVWILREAPWLALVKEWCFELPDIGEVVEG